MGKTLLQNLFLKLLLSSAFLFGIAVPGVYSQLLPAGSVAFTGFNGDADNDFAIVALGDIPANTDISFTDKELTTEGSIAGTGDTFTWNSGSSVIPAGTVITFNDISTGGRTVSEGSYTGGSAITLKVNGAVIFAFQGTEGDPSFLASIATDSGMYDELDSTDLDLGSTAILLSANIDVAEYVGDRSGNTPNGYLSELNDIDNWVEQNGSGDQSGNILPFDGSDFPIVNPPTVAFTAAAVDSSENSGTADLTVKLVEATGTAVDADVAFLSGSSTATNGDDFANFTTETVSFTSNDSDGATRTVSVNLTDDSDFEGTEKAVFQLQNVRESLAIGGDSPGTAISPDMLTLNITDDDVPDIVFNEINADPGNDANGDGNTDSDTDEFIEWVNNTGKDIDISGWVYADGNSDRFTFPQGTVIPAGNAVVLFDNSGDVQPQGNFGGAHVFTDDEIGLNNTSEELTLSDADGNTIATATYPNEADGQSNVLSPEITGNSYVDHSSVSGSGGSLSSPGTQVDGTPFGSDHAIAFRGSEGWRMISSPVQSATFNDLLGNLWMQGVTGSKKAPGGNGTLFSWDETGGGTFSAPNNMSDNMTPGRGYIVYVFEDDEFSTPGIQGGFPKIINAEGTENSGTVTVGVTANDTDGSSSIDGNEGWNLLGNPFDTDISVDALFAALDNASPGNVNANIYVWDHDKSGGPDYVELSQGDGERLAPFQAFWVKYEQDGIDANVSLNRNDLSLNQGTDFHKNAAEDPISLDLELHGEDNYFDTYSLEFSKKGAVDLDRYDGYHLFSLDANSINLFSVHGNNRLQKNALPKDLESALEIPLSFDASGRTSLTFRWDKQLQDLPREWDFFLIDKQNNREIDMRRTGEYSFATLADREEQNTTASNDRNNLMNKTGDKEEYESRFVLSIQPQVKGNQTDLPNSVKLNPNYPNPFNPQTTIPYELTQESKVKLTVWNMIGQKVATLVDGVVEAGTHEESWNASSMPSGIYIARFEVNGKVFTRKMTLIK